MLKSIFGSAKEAVTDSEYYIVIAVVILFLLLLVAFPVITIIAINYLFNTSIPINFFTFCAVLWLSVAFGGGGSGSKN